MILKNQKIKKFIIAIFTFVGFFVFFDNARANQISNIIWMGNEMVAENSITSMQLNIIPTTSGYNGPFTYQIEYGTYDLFTGGSPPQTLPSIPSDFINPLSFSPQSTTNQANINLQFTGLLPAHVYYFRLHEVIDNDIEPRGPYRVVRTNPPELVSINFSTNNINNSLTVSGNFGPAMSGKPVRAFLSSSPITATTIYGANELVNTLPLDLTLGSNGSYTFIFGGGGETLPGGGGISPGTTYYFKVFNNNSSSQLPLITDSIAMTIPDNSSGDGTGGQGTGNQGGGGQGTGNQGGQTGTDFGFESGEDFSGGLVTCSGIDCQFAHLLTTANRVIRFAIFVIGIPIITLVFVYAGFLLITSGGNPSKKDEAKSIIGKAITGLLFMLGAWLLIRTVLIILGYEGPLLGVLGM